MKHLENFGLNNRMGTEEEVLDVCMLIALGLYQDAISFSKDSPLSDKAHELGMNKYIQKYVKYYQNHIDNNLFVTEYLNYDIKIFTCVFQTEEKKPKHSIFLCHLYFLKTKTNFTAMDSLNGIIIDFSNEEKLFKKSNLGRPSKPTEDSLLKTIQINRDIDRLQAPNTTIDDICKKHNLAKSSYYRVTKWLSINPLISLLD